MRRRALLSAALCLLAPILAAAAPGRPNIAALSRSLAAEEQRVGTAGPDLIPIIDRLAQWRYRTADFAAARSLRRRSLAIARAAFGGQSAAAAEAETGLAATYIDMQRYLDAEPLLLAARIDLTARFGPQAAALAPVLSGLARIALSRGKPQRAERLARAAVAIDRSDAETPAPRRSAHLRVLGAALAAEDRYAASAPVLREALALARGGARAAGPATARSLSRLGKLYLRQHRYRKALPLIEQAALIDQQRLASDHPTLAGDWYDLGVAWLGLKRLGDAARAFRTAVGRLSRGPGRGTPAAANIELGLARACHEQGHEKQARALFDDAGAILHDGAREEHRREARA